MSGAEMLEAVKAVCWAFGVVGVMWALAWGSK